MKNIKKCLHDPRRYYCGESEEFTEKYVYKMLWIMCCDCGAQVDYKPNPFLGKRNKRLLKDYLHDLAIDQAIYMTLRVADGDLFIPGLSKPKEFVRK